MRLEWIRPKSELKSVLLEPRADGPEVAYWIFTNPGEKWMNMTLLAPGTYGTEFNKTFGHYHTPKVLETYKLISGAGIFILQKKFYEKGVWRSDKVAEIYMVKVGLNEEITVPLEFAHSWSNVGETPLITLDDWHQGHVKADYEPMKNYHGMCFYIVKEKGLKFLPNKHYKNHPEPKVVTVKEFQRLYPVR